MTLSRFTNDARNSNDRTMMDLTRAVDALAKDVTERLTSFGKWMEALEVRLVPGSADIPRVDTSIAVLEA